MKFEKILVTDPFGTKEDLAELKKVAKKVIYCEKGWDSTADNEIGTTDLLIVRSRTPVTKEIFDKAPNLKYVITATHGIDHIDVSYARKKGVEVHTTPSSIQSVAELVFGNIITLYRHIPRANKTMHKKQWKKYELTGSQLSGKTLGIIGLGRIGRKVAQLAHYGFNMRVVYYDPYVKPGTAGSLLVWDWIAATQENVQPWEEEFQIVEGFGFCKKVTLKELLEQSDALSFHCPLTKDTKYMLTKKELKQMKDDAVLINLSRGQVVRDDDVVDALEKGTLGGAALDVFEKEPLPHDHVFIDAPQLILTPHIGGQTTEARENIGATVLKIVKSLADNN